MVKDKDGYYRNRHSCFLLQYHLVLITKYRHPVITGELMEDMKSYTADYYKKRKMPILEMEFMPDHIHIMFEAPPQINMADFVNAYKSATSRRARQLFQSVLAEYYWKPYYFIGSVSEKSTSIVKKYIQNQTKK